MSEGSAWRGHITAWVVVACIAALAWQLDTQAEPLSTYIHW